MDKDDYIQDEDFPCPFEEIESCFNSPPRPFSPLLGSWQDNYESSSSSQYSNPFGQNFTSTTLNPTSPQIVSLNHQTQTYGENTSKDNFTPENDQLITHGGLDDVLSNVPHLPPQIIGQPTSTPSNHGSIYSRIWNELVGSLSPTNVESTHSSNGTESNYSLGSVSFVGPPPPTPAQVLTTPGFRNPHHVTLVPASTSPNPKQDTQNVSFNFNFVAPAGSSSINDQLESSGSVTSLLTSPATPPPPPPPPPVLAIGMGKQPLILTPENLETEMLRSKRTRCPGFLAQNDQKRTMMNHASTLTTTLKRKNYLAELQRSLLRSQEDAKVSERSGMEKGDSKSLHRDENSQLKQHSDSAKDRLQMANLKVLNEEVKKDIQDLKEKLTSAPNPSNSSIIRFASSFINNNPKTRGPDLKCVQNLDPHPETPMAIQEKILNSFELQQPNPSSSLSLKDIDAMFNNSSTQQKFHQPHHEISFKMEKPNPLPSLGTRNSVKNVSYVGPQFGQGQNKQPQQCSGEVHFWTQFGGYEAPNLGVQERKTNWFPKENTNQFDEFKEGGTPNHQEDQSQDHDQTPFGKKNYLM